MNALRAFVLAICLAIISGGLSAQSFHPDYKDGQLFIKVEERSTIGMDASQQAENHLYPFLYMHQKVYGITEMDKALPMLQEHKELRDIYLIEFTDISRTEELIQLLEGQDFVVYAEKVPLYKSTFTPNDPDIGSQWYLGSTYIDAYNAWDLSLGASGVVVAIIDNAVRLSHEDLAPVLWVNPGEIPGNGIDDDGNGYIDDINGWDAADNDNDPDVPAAATSSVFTHGTHCAGIAAAATDNSLGVASIGSGVSIMAVKCTEDVNLGPTLDNTFGGMQYVVATGADVASMSFGGSGSSATVQSLINVGYSNGITWIAAAGNSNTDATFYPAGYNNVISVASSTTGDVKSSFSNYGAWIDITAPGSNIYSCLSGNDSDYGYLSGTSMACPMVAGLAALIKSYNPSFTPADIENCLLTTADNIDGANPSYIGELGAGRINALAALTCANPNLPPVANFSGSPTNICVGGSVSFTDLSLYSPTSYSWSFPGAAPATSSAANPTVTYAAGGTYDVTLIVNNAFGADTLTQTAYINVSSTGLPLPFSEDFESGGFSSGGWSIENPDGSYTWEIATISGTTPGNQAAKLNFYDYSATGQRDAFVSPAIDLSSATTAQMTFEYAYRRYNTASSDSMIVYVSDDCGVTFDRVVVKGENGTGSFATQTTSTAPFTAGTGDWCFGSVGADCDTVDLTPYIGSGNVVVKFQSYNNYGNNLFIDNINITGTTGPVLPVADFIGVPTTVFTGGTVDFTDLSSGTPTSWNWSFPGAATATSSAANPSGIVYPTAGTYDVTLIVSNASGSDTLTKLNYITVVDPGVGVCDTLSNFVGSASLYTLTGVGYLSGHNTFNDQAKADYFDNAVGATSVNSVLMAFGTAFANAPATSKITVHVWDATGPAGTPGASLTSEDVLIQDISNDITAGDFTEVIFTTPATVSGDFYVGFELFYGAGGTIDDTVAILTTTIGSLPAGGGTAWEQFDSGDWYNYNDADSSWNIDVAHAIFPVVCGVSNEPIADFVANRTLIYEGQDIDFFDLSTNDPTSWSWDFPGGTPATSSVENPANIVYNTAGLYDATLIAGNLFGNDTMTKPNYIEVLPTPSGCDSLINISGTDTLRLYSLTGGGGWLAGHNALLDQAKAEKFTVYPPGTELSGGLFYFGHATSSGPAAKVIATVWDNSGPGGAPGAVLATEDVLLDDIVADVAADELTYVSFSSPPIINTDFYLGVQLIYNLGDTVALVTNTIGQSVPATAWDQDDLGDWHAYDDPTSWDIGLSHAILPIMCNSVFEAEFEADDTTICAGETVNFTDLSSSIASGWSWSFPGGIPSTSTLRNPSVTYFAGGTYAVTLTATGPGVSDTETKTAYITVYPNPTLDFDRQDISCNGLTDGQVTVTPATGTPPFSYTWSTGSSSATLVGLGPGTYSVTVTDANGCSDNGAVTIIEPAPLTLSLSKTDPLCFGDTTGSITATPSGGALSYMYSLDGVSFQSSPIFSGLPAGPYTVLVQDSSGCNQSASITLLNPTAISVTASATDASCGASDGSATATVTGGTSPFNYSWTGGATAATATGLAAGTYDVTVTDDNGCSATATATVSNIGAPSISVSANDVSCAGDADGTASVSVSGGTMPYTYNWSNGSPWDTTAGLSTGTVFVTVTDASGCISVGSAVVNAPPVLTASAVGTDEGCNQANGAATVNVSGGTPGYTYLWSNGETTMTITGINSGLYTVTVTDNSGCTVSTNAAIGNIPGPSSAINTTNASCPGIADGTANLNVVGGLAPFSYIWSNGATTEDLTAVTPGTYTVTITDANGCQNVNTATVAATTPMVISISATMASGSGASDGSATANPVGGTSPYTYSWSTGATGATVSGLSLGTYVVTVTDANGCQVVDSVGIYVVGLEPISNISLLNAYPNPTEDFVNIDLTLNRQASVQLKMHNSIGQMVHSETIENHSAGVIPVDMTALAAGVYTLSLQTDGEVLTIQLVKSR